MTLRAHCISLFRQVRTLPSSIFSPSPPPSCPITFPHLTYSLPLSPPPDYLKSEPDFLKKVEHDATAFRPPGTKIASYARRAPDTGNSKGKGKTRADAPVDEDADDAVVYEVYHVSVLFGRL